MRTAGRGRSIGPAMQSSEATIEQPGGIRARRPSVVGRIASLAPFGLALALSLLTKTYVGHALDTPPAIVGLPLGVVMEGLVLAWAALGALIIWTTSSRAATALAMAFMTLPSMLAIIFTPAIILILQTLP